MSCIFLSVSLLLSLQRALTKLSGFFLPNVSFIVSFRSVPFASGPDPDHYPNQSCCRSKLVSLVAIENRHVGFWEGDDSGVLTSPQIPSSKQMEQLD